MEFEKTKLIELKEKFDSIINTEEKENVEFWYAIDLQEQLGYTQWRNFLEVIKKAMRSCESAGITVDDYFAEVSKMVTLGSVSKRKLQDYMLTRYACYLIAQNGDSKKQEIFLEGRIWDSYSLIIDIINKMVDINFIKNIEKTQELC